MTTPRHGHSGFARFESDIDRHDFMERVLSQRPDIKQHAFLPRSQPQVVFENIDDDQLGAVRSALRTNGQWFEDIQFEPMPDREG